MHMMENFFVKHEIPAFEDKRLNKDAGAEGRTKIKRLGNLNQDDVAYQNRALLPDIPNIRYRVQEATHAERIAAEEDMTTNLKYLQEYDESNTVLLEHIRNKREKRLQMIDLQENDPVAKLRESGNYSLKLLKQYKHKQQQKRDLFIADQRRMELAKEKRAVNLKVLRDKYGKIQNRHHLVDFREV